MNSITGTYKLVKYGYQYKADDRFENISDGYDGVIHYSPEGFMSVVLRFEKQPTDFSEIVAYCGSYKVSGDEIVHQVTMSVRPEYEGQTLVRKFKCDAQNLETEFENTDEFRKFAIWKRI